MQSAAMIHDTAMLSADVGNIIDVPEDEWGSGMLLQTI